MNKGFIKEMVKRERSMVCRIEANMICTSSAFCEREVSTSSALVEKEVSISTGHCEREVNTSSV